MDRSKAVRTATRNHEYVNKLINSISSNKERAIYIARNSKKLKEEHINICRLHDSIQKEKMDYFRAETLLSTAYNTYKKDTVDNLQDKMNLILNRFFSNNHNLRIVTGVRGGVTTVNLVEVDTYGRELGALGVMLSGAEQQMFGFLIQQITLTNLGSNFIFLDEAFSSFGVKEIHRLFDIIDNINETQMVVIEHKEEMFQDREVETVHIRRKNGSTYIDNISDRYNNEPVDTEFITKLAGRVKFE